MSRSERHAQAAQKRQLKAALGRTLDWETRARSGAVRTAWIVGGLALAFFVFALVEGHRGKLYPSWEPVSAPPAATTPTTHGSAPAFEPAPAIAPVADPAGAAHASGAAPNTSSSRS